MPWIERLDQAPRALSEPLSGPLAWIAPHAEAAGWPLPPACAEDLADAAYARRDGGGPRLLRRRMLRALAARVFALHPDTVRFTRDARGAPGLDGLDAYISTAGCEGWSAVALSPTPVGVDIAAGGEAADLPHWTLLEAAHKAHGRGLGEDEVRPPRRTWLKVEPAFTAALAIL